MHPRPLVLLLAALALGGGPALGGEATRSFAEADRNRDGIVDRKEMERRTLQVFSFADNDKDAYLSRDEYASLVIEEPLSAADTDRDGRVSTREFVAVRMRDFDASDTNHDGVLSEDETGRPEKP